MDAVEGGHGLRHGLGVRDAGRLDGTVHRELGTADVRHRDGQRVALQVAQRAAAGLVGAVREHRRPAARARRGRTSAGSSGGSRGRCRRSA